MVSPHPPGMDCVPGCFEPMIYPGPDPYSDWDGISPDYFGAVAYATFGPGWVHGPTYGYTGPMPWSYPSFYLTFYLDLEQVGKHLVFDKATWTGVSWVWSQLEANPGPTVNVNPAWGGPYEYYIAYAPDGEVDVNLGQGGGFSSTDTIIAGRTVTIPLTYDSDKDWNFTELINCYQLSSPDGIFWTDLEAMPLLANIGDLAAYILSPHPDDMVGLRFLADEGDPLVAPFATDMAYLTFKTTTADAGKTITIDAFIETGQSWLWYSPQAPQPPGYIEPAWPGQITLVVAPCCEGMTGNADCSQSEEPDISDITRLIDFLYISHEELCCPGEADVDGSGGEPDISDITALIDHLYLSHDPLVDCPETVMSNNMENNKVKGATANSGFQPRWIRTTEK
jgi:hypothetical protein